MDVLPLYFVIAVFSGLFGSILGLGGGMFLVPGLTMVGVPIKTAIAASMLSIVATSCAASSDYLRQKMANLRLSLVLEFPAVGGTMLGALLVGYVRPGLLKVIFAVALIISAFFEIKDLVVKSRARSRSRSRSRSPSGKCDSGEGQASLPVPDAVVVGAEGALEEALRVEQGGGGGSGESRAGEWTKPGEPARGKEPKSGGLGRHLGGTFVDPVTQQVHHYEPKNLGAGLGLLGLTSLISGMLGIGVGALRVVVLDTVMGLPLRASIGTATLMLGVTAAGGAIVFMLGGVMDDTVVAGASALGILIGARLGPKIMVRLGSFYIQAALVLVLLVLSVRMLAQALFGG